MAEEVRDAEEGTFALKDFNRSLAAQRRGPWMIRSC